MTQDAYVMESWPVPASAAEYEQAAEELEGALRRIPGLVAIYATGAITAPGISDIDRIAVVEAGPALRPIWADLSERTRALALHTPFVVDVETFSRHRWFAHLEPLELRWGTAVEIVEPPEAGDAEWLLAVEGASLTALKLLRQAVMRRVKVRSALCELHTLRYALRLGGLSERDAEAAWRFTRDVAGLREEWFMLSRQVAADRTLRLVRDAGPATTEVLQALSAKRATREAAPERVRLGGSWSNVVLTQGQPATATGPSATRRTAPWSRSARLASLVWRSRTRRLTVPPATIRALDGAVSVEANGYAAGRRQIVDAYRAFLDENAPSYSSIGLAPQLLRR